jgi:hypothetical protein
MNARPSRLLCTAYNCARPVGLNGFFCVQDWARLGEERQHAIVRADRRGRGLEVRDLVRAARRTLDACNSAIVRLHARREDPRAVHAFRDPDAHAFPDVGSMQAAAAGGAP